MAEVAPASDQQQESPSKRPKLEPSTSAAADSTPIEDAYSRAFDSVSENESTTCAVVTPMTVRGPASSFVPRMAMLAVRAAIFSSKAFDTKIAFACSSESMTRRFKEEYIEMLKDVLKYEVTRY